ncbi:GEVED domain-containing protein [Isoptericola sp. NPDC057191]|uniref:DUF7927 domain-containing protein n=1 Tax=Isoptericola sp. NPDC057191 TaxID=3346041 RepID=UPI00362D6253
MSAVTAGVLALGGTLVVVATPVTSAPTAAAVPGNPGVPGDPEVLYTEDFENAPNGSNVLLTDYTGAQGTSYTAAAFWANRANCNGFIVDWGSPRDAADCTDVSNAASVYDAMLAIPHALGQLRGVDPQTNGAAASYTADGATGAQIQFQTATPVALPVANRFVTFSVDAGAMNCNVSAPLLRFYFLDAANTETAVSSSPINVCTDPRGETLTGVPTPGGTSRTVRVGTFAANGSTLVTGDSLGIRLRNQNSAANGNDGAYDNIQVLDVSPQLDKEFSPTSAVVGGRSTLTFTVTNTSELAGKDGWEFTDNLPAGLEVARPPSVETDCDADVAATGGGTTVAVTNGVLAAGETSCTISVDVTSRTAGTYTNGPSDVEPTTGLDLPAETSVTFTPFVGSGACPTPAFLFQNAPSATPTEIDLVTGELVDRPALTDVAFNGVGYSELADAFFGMDNPTDQIYLVSPDYTTVANLGSPDYSNVSFTFAQLFPNGVPIGDVSPDGVLYLGGGGSGTRSWMAVDVDQDSPTYLQVLDGGTVPAPAAPVNAGLDWVYNPDDGRLYSFGVNTNNGNAFIYAFDPDDPSAGFVQVAALGALTAPNGQSATGGSSPFGATYGSPGFLYGANNQTGQIWRIPADDPTSATFFAYGPGPTNNNDGARCATAPILADLGDAPDTYGTTLSRDGARHGLVGFDATTNTAPLMLGDANTVDPDDDGAPTPDASGDDAAGVDDEAAVASPVEVSPTSESTVSVTVTNDADEPATLAGWVDLDGDGIFTAGERATAAVPAGSGTAAYDLTFPAAATSGDTFARFRVFSGAVDDPAPTGAVSGGEVEDYPAAVVAEPFVPDLPLQCGTATRYRWITTNTFYNDDFGTASVRNLWVPDGGVAIDPDGAETTNNGVAGDANPYLSPVYINDATGATAVDGGLLGEPVATTQIPDASDMGDYGETVTDAAAANGLVPRSEVMVTVSHVSGTPGAPVSLTLSKPSTNTVLTAYVTDSDGTVLDTVPWRIAPDAVTETLDGFDYPADGQLYVYTLDLDPAVRGLATSVLGFACPTDLGDAPDSYGTTVASDGPRHELLAFDPEAGTSPLMLGSAVDAEDDGVPSAGADGDDTAGAADDEDGVAAPIRLSPVGATTVTVSVTNDTDAAATLAGWVDLDGDGAFQADERQSVTVPASSGTADYELAFGAATTTAGTYARFRLFPGDVPAPSPTGPADGGEVEDYPADVLQAGLTITKSTDAADQVLPGDTVTYTVTVENTGGVPYTADDPAAFTDDLTDVLDDATYGGDATADAGTVDYSAPTLSWSGPLAVGEAATITYSVTVGDPLPAGGDGTLTNAVVGPAESSCVDGTEEGCTTDLPVRSLQITKTADPAAAASAGGTVTYTVTVENTGQVEYTADAPATFTDDLTEVLDDAAWDDDAAGDVGTVSYTEPELSWSGALGVGEVATITYSVTVGDPPAGDEELVNAVTGPPESNCDDGTEEGCTVTLPVLMMEIEKTADVESVAPGGTVGYTVTLTNTGTAPFTAESQSAAFLLDDLSGVLDDATYNDDAAADGETNNLGLFGTDLFWVGPLEVGEAVTVTYSVTVNDPVTGDGVLVNALVGPPASNCDDGTEEGCTTQTPVQSLEITKSADPAGEVLPGGTVAYTVTVENTGQYAYTADDPATFTDDLTDVLDDAAYGDDATADVGTVDYSEPTLTWSGALDPGQTATVTYSVTVDDPVAADGDGTLTNAVVGPPESTCDDGTEDGCTTAVPVRALQITKTSDPAAEVAPGGTVRYTVTVENTGQVAYTADDPATVTDDLTGVLDDASWNSDATADTGAVSYAEPTLSWSGALEPGETATIRYSVTVDDPLAEDGDGTLTNAVVGPPESTCDDGTEDGCTTDVPIRTLEIHKSADPADAVTPGGVVTYTVTVENTGQVPYTAENPARFTDLLFGVLDDATWNDDATADIGTTSYRQLELSWSGALDPGETATITYSVTVDDPPAAGGNGRLTNLVFGPSESNCAGDPNTPEQPPGSPADCVTTVPIRALTITKTADPAGEVAPGDTVTYTVTVQNTGQASYTADDPATFDDDLTDVLDDATFNDDATADVGTATYAEPTLSWSGALEPGETATITYSVTVDDPHAEDGDSILTNAVVGPPESSCDDGTEDGCTTDVPVRALQITKSADPADAVAPGGTVTYTVTVENTGQVAYTADDPASVTDDLSDVLDDATWNDDATADVGTATYAEPTLSWSGALAPGETATITYSVTVDDPPAEDGDGTLTNAVVGPPESSCDDGTEDGCTTDLPVRALQITKTADPADEVAPGGTVTYTVTVQNTGQAPYTADDPATFTDDLTGVLDDAAWNDDATADVGTTSYAEPTLSWSGALEPGATATITYSVTVDDPPAEDGDGTLTNAVVGPPESTCDDGTEDGCTTDVPVRALEISKTAAPAGSASPADTVTYTVTVTNTGKVAYSADDPASFTDDLSDVLDDAAFNDDATADVGTASYAEPTLSWSGALEPGATATITYSVTVDAPPAEDGDGTLTNSVVGPPESNCDDGTEDSCTTDVPVNGLEIRKTADPQDAVTAGDTVTYTITVTNTGQTAYTDESPATVTDDLTNVLDDAVYDGDATADVGEVSYAEPELSWSGALDPGETATITYSVTVGDPPGGDATLANAVLGPPESNCPVAVPTGGGGMAAGVSTAIPQLPEGCQVVTPVRAFEVTKSVDTDEAAPGDLVTYTVTVTSTGAAPYTDEEPASVSDDLSDVLDDATPAGLPTASAGELRFDDPVLAWRGPLDVGGTVTVTYALRVDDPAAGDGTMVNVVVTPEGSGGSCAADDGCTTSTDVVPGSGGGFLPRTGADVVAALLAAVVLLLGGALLYRFGTRRREE